MRGQAETTAERPRTKGISFSLSLSLERTLLVVGSCSSTHKKSCLRSVASPEITSRSRAKPRERRALGKKNEYGEDRTWNRHEDDTIEERPASRPRPVEARSSRSVSSRSPPWWGRTVSGHGASFGICSIGSGRFHGKSFHTWCSGSCTRCLAEDSWRTPLWLSARSRNFR